VSASARPTIEAKETYYRGKRDLMCRPARANIMHSIAVLASAHVRVALVHSPVVHPLGERHNTHTHTETHTHNIRVSLKVRAVAHGQVTRDPRTGKSLSLSLGH
jgi:hypothetical protein